MGVYSAVFGILITLGLVCFTAGLAKRYGFEIIAVTYAVLVVTGTVLAAKIVNFGIFTVPSAIIVAAATFFTTDVISELWGKKQAERVIWFGILGLAIFAVSQFISVHWPSPIENSLKYDEVMSQTPRIAVASFLAYFVSQFLDVNVFHLIKKITNDRFLWIRNNGSTFLSQLVDTIVFISAAFYGTYPNKQIILMICSMLSVKLFIAVLDTPFFYIAIWMFKEDNDNICL